jgi:hypothetical protein
MFLVATDTVCLHDVSLMHTSVESAHGMRGGATQFCYALPFVRSLALDIDRSAIDIIGQYSMEQ